MTTTLKKRPVYNNKQACKAIALFEHLCKTKDGGRYTSKDIIALTIMAYMGKFSVKRLKEVVCEASFLIKELVAGGIVTKLCRTYDEGNVYELNYSSFNLQEKHVSEDVAFLFTNALFNMKEYTTSYGIKSWNVLALALETTLKTGYSSTYVSLAPDDIHSVLGNDINKRSVRKSLVDLGFIQERKSLKRTQQYRLNKRAYLLGTNS